MPRTTIVRESHIEQTPRVVQMQGMFDVAPAETNTERWQIYFELPNEWNVGLIVGPSGSGKTTVATELFGDTMIDSWNWPSDKSILDGFPDDMSIKDITALLSSVGFSSPPSWMRPFHVLSNGEQFRVHLARTLAEQPERCVVDEFTSVVDRTVARVGSAAVAKTVRRRGQQFVAVACHYDIIDWLEPDWVFQPHTNEFSAGRSVRRPDIHLEIRRVHHSAWELFRTHHYLDTSLNKAAACFVAFWKDKPCAFAAVLHFPHAKVKNIKREHRVVCLPDYQGVGIGNVMSAYMGQLCRTLGYRYQSQTSHPAMIRSRAKHDDWNMVQEPTIKRPKSGNTSTMEGWLDDTRRRMVATFEYVGDGLGDVREALRVWKG